MFPPSRSAPAAEPRLLSARQVAERTQTSLRSVRRWIAAGDLTVHRLGRSIRIAEPDLERFLATCRSKMSVGGRKCLK